MCFSRCLMFVGSSEWVCAEGVFPLMPQFSRVPPLAWQCCLTDVYPLEGSRPEFPGGWNSETVNAFTSLLPEGSICEIFITNPRSVMVNEILQVYFTFNWFRICISNIFY